MNKLPFLLFLAACGGATADATVTPDTPAPRATAAATADPAPSDATHDELCLVLHFKREYARAMTECAAACDESAKDSCKILGAMYENGEGTPADAARAATLYAKACKLGNSSACETHAPPAAASSGGVHFSVGSIEADGVVLTDLACNDVQGGLAGGLFGGIALAAGFKSRKAQLDACAPRGTTTHVEWAGAGGRMTHVKARGASPAIDRCVERALAGAPSTITGSCSTNVRHGR